MSFPLPWICLWWFLLCTLVNHHLSPPFGRVSLTFSKHWRVANPTYWIWRSQLPMDELLDYLCAIRNNKMLVGESFGSWPCLVGREMQERHAGDMLVSLITGPTSPSEVGLGGHFSLPQSSTHRGTPKNPSKNFRSSTKCSKNETRNNIKRTIKKTTKIIKTIKNPSESSKAHILYSTHFFHFHRTLSQEPHPPQPGNQPNDDGDWLDSRPEGHGVLFRVLQTAPSDEDGTGWFSWEIWRGPKSSNGTNGQEIGRYYYGMIKKESWWLIKNS